MEIKVVEKQIHDVVFTTEYVKLLLNSGKVEEVKQYMKRFFFRYGISTFFYDAMLSEFQLFSNEDIKKKIPNDLIKKNYELKKTVEFSCKDYLSSTEFMNINYYPTINFSKPITYTSSIYIS